MYYSCFYYYGKNNINRFVIVVVNDTNRDSQITQFNSWLKSII